MERSEIVFSLERQQLPVLESTLAVVEKWRQQSKQIDEILFSPEARVEHLEKADQEAFVGADKALEAALEKDVELSRLRAERARVLMAAGGADLLLHERAAWQAFPEQRDTIEAEMRGRVTREKFAAELPAHIALTAALTDPAVLVRNFAGVELTNDPTLIRAVGQVTLSRLQVLEAGGSATARQHLAEFRATFNAWQRHNPSHLDQLRRIDDALAMRESRVRSGHQWTLRYAKLTLEETARRRRLGRVPAATLPPAA